VATVEHNDSVRAVQFSPDSKYLATVSLDGTSKILELERHEVVANIEHEGDYVMPVRISPDSKYMAKASGAIVTVWPFQPKELIKEACSRLTRNLSQEEWDRYLPRVPYRQTCPCEEC
jgi:WD40 repeat protein